MKSALVRFGDPENERVPDGRLDRWASICQGVNFGIGSGSVQSWAMRGSCKHTISKQFFSSLSLVFDLKVSISCLLKASLPSSRSSFIGNCKGITERKSDSVEKAMNVPSAK